MTGKHLWFLTFAIMLIISVAVDFWLQASGATTEHWWTRIPGFFALFGFTGCIALIIVAKLAAHHWLQRKEDYYNKHDHAD
ncbi:hypothetical protein ACFLVX_00540 [Chloroflexota bacterium]